MMRCIFFVLFLFLILLSIVDIFPCPASTVVINRETQTPDLSEGELFTSASESGEDGRLSRSSQARTPPLPPRRSRPPLTVTKPSPSPLQHQWQGNDENRSDAGVKPRRPPPPDLSALSPSYKRRSASFGGWDRTSASEPDLLAAVENAEQRDNARGSMYQSTPSLVVQEEEPLPPLPLLSPPGYEGVTPVRKISAPPHLEEVMDPARPPRRRAVTAHDEVELNEYEGQPLNDPAPRIEEDRIGDLPRKHDIRKLVRFSNRSKSSESIFAATPNQDNPQFSTKFTYEPIGSRLGKADDFLQPRLPFSTVHGAHPTGGPVDQEHGLPDGAKQRELQQTSTRLGEDLGEVEDDRESLYSVSPISRGSGSELDDDIETEVSDVIPLSFPALNM